MHHLCARLLPTLQCPMHAVASHAVGALTTARLKGCLEHTSHTLEGRWALRGLLWSPPWASCSLLMDSLSHLSPCGSCSWLTSPLSGSLKRLYLPSVSPTQLLTLPSERGLDLLPLLAAWHGLGRHAWPQMPLSLAGGRVGGPSRSGCDRPGPSVRANAAPGFLGLGHSHSLVDRQLGSDAEAEEFPFSWDLGMGVASMPRSDTLCY